MLIYTYQHKSLMRITWPSAITGLTVTTHVNGGLIPDLVTSRIEKKVIVLDTEYPYTDQVSLHSTNKQIGLVDSLCKVPVLMYHVVLMLVV